ncbi:A24 family peptidase [Streptomyces sp. NPDC047000]|uniref:A24 family peptidase n=1 Tax=Streptomyces sp. NPDC047000 TaxID=3155474 RepID=UPI003403D79E
MHALLPPLTAALAALAALWGAGAGLLLPRAAHRLSVEAGEPWSGNCPEGHPIAGAFGGWVGRARCTERVPPAPACGGYGPDTAGTATVTALTCAALAAASGPHPETVVWLLLAPVAVLLALVDLRVHRLPDVLTLPLAAATAVLLGVAAALSGATGSWPAALLGGLALGAAYFVLFLVNPAGLGFGDVKLALALGTALGWYGRPVLVTGAFAGLGYGALYGLSLVVLRRAGRRTAIALGPFMIAGAFTGLLLGAFGAR